MRRTAAVLLASLLLAIPAGLAPGAAEAATSAKTDVFAGEAAFRHASLENARYDRRAGGFRLLDRADGGYAEVGSVTLGELHYNWGFDRVVASWNAECPPGTWITLELSASADGGKSWSGWYEACSWGDPETLRWLPRAASASPTGSGGALIADAWGRFNEDTLELKQKADRLRCRATLHSRRPEASPLLSLVALALADSHQSAPPDDRPGPAWGAPPLPPTHRFQGTENGDVAFRACGPTSTAMALAAVGVSVPTPRVTAACWDARHAIYGNWPYLAAGASALLRQEADRLPARPGLRKAFRAYVAWYPDWKGVEEEVRLGHPCLASIAFGPGELPGAGTPASAGHIVLVRGFTKTGDVICSDPASRHPEVVFDRAKLLRARHGNPVIVVAPYAEPEGL